MADSCIFCALKELFNQFQYSQESALPPDALRRALAETFCDQRRFQLGYMDDAAECFENILQRIHFHIANQESEDMCNVNHCIPHQKFAMTLVEQNVCHECRATSEPLPFTQMVHYVSTSALCSQARELSDPDVPFGTLLQRAGGLGDIRDCPATCGAKIQIRKTLMNRPDIVSIGLVWDSECPTLDHIMKVFQTLGLSLKLKDVFHSVVDSRWASLTDHQLVGVVTYYGKHYSTFFFHSKLGVWIYFDDATVREIGPRWEQVVEKCRRGHFQPLLLMYSSPQGTPINSLSAPKTITLVPGHKKTASGQVFHEAKEVLKGGGSFAQQQIKNQRDIDGSQSYKPPPLLPPSYRQPSYEDRSQEEYNLRQYHESQQQILNYQSASMHHQWNSSAITSTNHANGNCEAALDSVQQFPPSHHPSNGTCNDGPIYRNINYVANNEHPQEMGNSTEQHNPDLHNTYINRKTVESVLNFQKLQRQRSLNGVCNVSGNRNSNSSLESFETLKKEMANKQQPLKVEIPEAENVPRRRDSGNWSSDNRAGPGSVSSGSIDNPYLYVVGSKRAHHPPNGYKSKHDIIGSDQGYDSFSVSSTDSYPSVTGSPIKLDPRLVQIPEHIQLLSEVSQQPDDCDKLCTEADILLTKSHEKEMSGDIYKAAILSDSAAAKARAAMDAPYQSAKSLMTAKMKHNICIMRSSCLHKKLKEAQAEEKRKQKDASKEGQHSRQSSRDSTHGRHSRQGSRDSSSGKKELHQYSEGSEKTIELYGTLPKKSSKKKSSTSPIHNDIIINSEAASKSSSGKSKSKSEKPEGHRLHKEQNLESHAKMQTLKSPEIRKKGIKNEKSHKKESDFSDYNSDWEQSKKQSLRRTYSGPSKNDELLSEDFDDDDDEENASDSYSGVTTNKKQHKIRRKLVMGAFLRRKNRSLPDLREGQGLSDDNARSFDDTTLKKDKHGDVNLSQLSRGFQQPHHAFVSKDLCNRPLLTRVTPPQVLESQNTAHTHKAKTMNSPTKSPMNNKLSVPPKPPPRIDSIMGNSGLTPPELLPPPPPELLYPSHEEEDEVFLQAPPPPSIDLHEQPPANPSSFLVELQSKRQQILISSKPKDPMALPDTPGTPEKKSSWLQELQHKQVEMLHKKKLPMELPVPQEKPVGIKAFEQALSPPRPSAKTEESPLKPTLQSKMQQMNLSPAASTDPQPMSKGGEAGDKPRSVRALASRFENIFLPKPEEQASPPLAQDLLAPPDLPNVESVESHDEVDFGRSFNHYPSAVLNKYQQPPSPASEKSFSNYDNGFLQKSHLPTVDMEAKDSFCKSVPLTRPQEIPNSNPSTADHFATLSKNNEINHLLRPCDVSTILDSVQFRTNILHNPHLLGNDPLTSSNLTKLASQPTSLQTIRTRNRINSLDSILSKRLPAHLGFEKFPRSSDSSEPDSCYSRSSDQSISDNGSQFSVDSQTSKDSGLPSRSHPPFKMCDAPSRSHIFDHSASINSTRSDNLKTTPQDCSPTQSLRTNEQTSCKLPPVPSHQPPTITPSSENKRPDKPPDYETALQRLELLRERSHSVSSCSNPSVTSNLKKKKKGPKKNVTFSDKVILVACADDEPEEHLPNPLLDKVYQQHFQQQEAGVDTSSTSANVKTDRQATDELTPKCNLCQAELVSTPNDFCPKCTAYLSRFKPR